MGPSSSTGATPAWYPGACTGADQPAWTTTPSVADIDTENTVTCPFEDRILDLGVIVVGGELAACSRIRRRGDEDRSAAYPDGLRQTARDVDEQIVGADTRNQHSLGLDLRHPDGVAPFRRWRRRPARVRQLQAGERLLAGGFDEQRVRSIPDRAGRKQCDGATGRGATDGDQPSVRPQQASRGCGPAGC